MIDRDVAMQRHVRNLKRSVGLAGNGSARYEYIKSTEQLMDTYLSKMDDLGYPLKTEPKRDRYVMNTQVMEKAMEQAVEQALKEIEDEVIEFLEKEVMVILENETLDLLNTISVQNNQFVAKRNPHIRNS